MIQAPKGTKDCLPGESYIWQHIEAAMREHAARAGYREVRTPVFEHTELFQRGVGDTTDIVQKEMYTFLDKGGRSITLKPEGTAGAARAMVEGKLYTAALPVKMYYLNNPIFRYENPQHGRLREHHQFGMECFGSHAPTADAELIILLLKLLEALGIKPLTVHLNSIGCPVCRPAYHEKLQAFLRDSLGDLCDNCRSRFDRNPLRALDCKEEGCKRVVKQAPVMLDMLCEECDTHFAALKALLDGAAVTYKVDPFIVRGLDYYTKTVFEIIMEGQREGLALCGGGRYDGLVEQISGRSVPGVGFGIGVERIIIELDRRGIHLPEPLVCEVYVANIEKERLAQAFDMTQQLRKLGLKAECDHMDRGLRAQFKYANKLGVPLLLMVGGEEMDRGMVKFRDMQDGREWEVSMEDAAHTALEHIRQAGGK